MHDLYRGGYSALQLYESHVNLTEIGLTPKELVQAGIPQDVVLREFALVSTDVSTVRTIESDPKKLLQYGLKLPDLIAAGFSVLELRGAGFNTGELFHAGLRDIAEYVKAGEFVRVPRCFTAIMVLTCALWSQALSSCSW